LLAHWDRDKAFAFLPMYDPRAEPHVSLVPEGERFKSFHVIAPDGRTYSRGAAAIEALASMSSTRVLGRLLRSLHLTPLMDVLYWVVARTRGFTGRYVRDAPGPIRWP
jgi:predicted DCC family thiol-disulfide oxidoreductase YuxK